MREELFVGGCGEDEAVGGGLWNAGVEHGSEIADAT